MKRILLFFVFIGMSVNAQSDNTKITVFWDASYSMLEKDLEKELFFLESYIKEKQVKTITLVVFANTIISNNSYDVEVDFEGFLNVLKKVQYDGSTSYPEELKKTSGTAFCFTDRFIKNQETRTSLHIINSTPFLEASVISKKPSNYIHLFDLNNDGINKLVQNNLLVEWGKEKDASGNDKAQKFKIRGYIFNNKGGIYNVAIKSIKDSTNVIASDEKGFYEMETFTNDIISYTTPKGKERVVRVDGTEEMELSIDFDKKDTEQLEQVIVKSARKSKVLGSTLEETRKLGYSEVRVTADQYTPAQTTVGEFITGKVPGIKFTEKNNPATAVIRGFSSVQGTSNYPLLFLDGVPIDISSLSRKADLRIIDPNNIAEVKVLKSLSATAIYGPQATNGVILITTKNQKQRKGKKKKKRGTTDIFSGELEITDLSKLKTPSSSFQNINDPDKTYNTYLKDRLFQNNDINFYMFACDYFLNKGDTAKAKRIISNIQEIYADVNTLKVLGYKYEEKGFVEEEKELYKRLHELYPNSLQLKFSYAKALTKTGEVRKGIQLLGNILNSTGLNNDFKQVVETEIKYIYNKHKITGNLVPVSLRKKTQMDGRVLIEWNDPSLNFNVQCINPTRNYYNWTHNTDKNQSRINLELKKDMSLQEFQLLNAEKGDWFFNVVVPSGFKNPKIGFLKMTSFKNFGKPNQTKEIKLYNINFNIPNAILGVVRIR